MIAFPDRLSVSFDGAFVQDSPLSWIARNSSKPGRLSDKETWVLHASANWSSMNIESSQEEVTRQLLDDFWNETGMKSISPIMTMAHRWRYAAPERLIEDLCLYDQTNRIGACGA